jgi:SAM-dependent methyltransferase
MIYFIVKKINVIKTALRRVYNPAIKRGNTVIDIGSGGMPYPRASIACDFYENNFERADLLKIDRPFVWANVEYLPFADKTFDFSIFSHVLEHLDNPAKALKEIQRISGAGYIETPNAFYEFIIPHIYHMSRCSVIDGILQVTMKKSWEESLPGEFEHIRSDMMACWHALNSYDSRALLTRYYWKDTINFIIQGSVGFKKPIDSIEYSGTIRPSWKKILRNFAYSILKPKKIDLEKNLRCPICKETLSFNMELSEAYCEKCKKTYCKYKECWDFRVNDIT